MMFSEILGVAFWDCVFLFTAGVAIRLRHWWQYRPLSHRRIHKLQVEAQSTWITGAAVTTSSEQPTPAPGTDTPGRGASHADTVLPQAVSGGGPWKPTATVRDTSRAAVGAGPAESPRSPSTPAGGPQQPVAVIGLPEPVAVTGPQPDTGEGWRGAAVVGSAAPRGSAS